jgi:hypothetical protein
MVMAFFGFGPGDIVELFLTLVLAGFLIAFRSRMRGLMNEFAVHTGWCMLVLGALPALLRMALLPHHPVPAPAIYDEFSHLLVADTLRHYRVANPPHALPQFFETFFVLQHPTYSSIYPTGQGLCLAIGRALFGTPWAGVVLSICALCACSYWMLRGWVNPLWALLGGLFAVIEFGPLNQWMNDYWGGAVPAAGGCLVFGALPRLVKLHRKRDGVLLGLGLAIDLLTRPYESLFLFLSVAVFLTPSWRLWRSTFRPLGIAAAFVACALGVTVMQNLQITGSPFTLPYTLSQIQYGVPAALTFQSDPVPHRTLTPQQELDYRMQKGFHGPGPETVGKFLTRLEYRVRFYRFFFLPALYLALVAFVVGARAFRDFWVLFTLLLFAVGVNFFPNWQFHYIAPATCLFLLVSVAGLRQISRIQWRGFRTGEEAAVILVALCFAHFGLWYTVHLLDTQPFSAEMRRYETWDGINHSGTTERLGVERELMRSPGKQLVFVRYWPRHIFQDEWIWNAADIDGSAVIWARDLGAEEDGKLKSLYPDRTVWLLEADAHPARLTKVIGDELEPAPRTP